MRLASYESECGWKPGVLVDGEVLDAGALIATSSASEGQGTPPASVRELLEIHEGGLPRLAAQLEEAAAGAAEARVGAAEDVRLGPPVPDPSKVLCVGINYRDHAAETGRSLPDHPDIFAKFATSLTGPTDELFLSDITPKPDYEGELAIVIGESCRRVAPEAAGDKIAGAMILNDITARDLQFNATQWLPGKAVDGSTPCGPALVTLDELGDLHDLSLVTRVNGVEVQRSSTGQMIFTIPQVVSYISHFLTLSPGDVITTGTPDGVGSRMDPPSWLAPGDVVEVEIERLGSLRNVVR